MAKAIVGVLHGRGITLTAESEATISGSRDPAPLNAWLAVAVRVSTVEALPSS